MFLFGMEILMGQAKTFTSAELDAVLAFVAERRYALRNRMLILRWDLLY